MQLIELTDQFEALGINVASITYDPVEFLKEVELDEGVEFLKAFEECSKPPSQLLVGMYFCHKVSRFLYLFLEIHRLPSHHEMIV